MKKLLFAWMAGGCCLHTAFGQQQSYIKPPSLGVHFFFNDFKGAAYARTHSLGTAFRDHQLTDFKDMAPGLALNYLEGLSGHVDLSVNFAGSFLDYPIPNHVPFEDDNFLIEGDASLNVKLMSDRYLFTPYLSGGLGVSQYKGYFATFIPLGVGLQLNLFDDAYLLINSQFRVAVSENANYHFYHSVGFAGTIGKRREPAKIVAAPSLPIVEAPKDRDGDGIIDSQDSCPDIAGLLKFNGCPDSDNDGIPDKDDKCPTVPGFARYQGCPIPDTDHDGINDEEDKCPTVPGFARYQGCPIPDRDNDGVNDEEDKCPDVPGDPANGGCPIITKETEQKIEYAAKNIFFNTGRYTLLVVSSRPLDEVAAILVGNKDLKLDIDGYTDNAGAPEKNQLLSQQRADEVKKYLEGKGVAAARLNAAGHGQNSPVADNKTNAGRAKNRRVELHVKY